MSLLGGSTEGRAADAVLNITHGSQECCGFKLSWKQRFYGWMTCFGIGILLSLSSTIALFLGDYVTFAVMVSCGTLIAVLSSLFLSGPMKQIKNMFKETRIFATITLFVMIVLTICAAVWWEIVALAIVFLILQELALTWYMLTWIPGARMVIKKCCKSTFEMD